MRTGIGFFQNSRSKLFTYYDSLYIQEYPSFSCVLMQSFFSRKNVKQKKVKAKKKKPYTPFPPPQQPSKVSQPSMFPEKNWICSLCIESPLLLFHICACFNSVINCKGSWSNIGNGSLLFFLGEKKVTVNGTL